MPTHHPNDSIADVSCSIQLNPIPVLPSHRPGDTVHLVKGASKTPAPPAAQQVPQNLSTGNAIAGNPLAPLLNGERLPSSHLLLYPSEEPLAE